MNSERFRKQVHRAVEKVSPAMKSDPFLAQKIRVRAWENEEKPLKRRVSAGAVILTAFVVISMGVGIAAVSGWDVMQFLYGDRTAQQIPEIDVFPIRQEVSGDGALFRVDSAVYDGKYLAFDWHFENTEPETPICGYIQKLTANGIPVAGDGGESFEFLWLPSKYIESNFWQNGASVVLPADLAGTETVHIDMLVKVYRPTCAVYEMEKFNMEEAVRKTEEGYFVITEDEGFFGYDPYEEQWTVSYGIENSDGRLRETALEISFDVPKGENSDRVLKPLPVYETEHGTASYDVAAVTAGGLHLTLRLHPDDVALNGIRELILTDGDGSALQGDRFAPDVALRLDSADPGTVIFRYRWSDVRPKDLPDTVSLTCVLEDGTRLLFPVAVR